MSEDQGILFWWIGKPRDSKTESSHVSDTPLPTTPEQPDQAVAEASDWVIIVRPLASNVPAAIRVRRVLKYMLRSQGLQCMFVGGRLPTTANPVEPKPRRKKVKPG
jgi:hypothetical protein